MRQGEETRSTRRKSCPGDTFSTIIPTWTGLKLNPNLRGGWLTTNRLKHDMAVELFWTQEPY
jgi:hypothetical protein